MSLTSVLLAVIVVLALVLIHFRRKADGLAEAVRDLEAGRESTWGSIRESWAQLRGGVLNMVVAGDAGAGPAAWVSDHAPHGKGGPMGRRDADLVCVKACSGWAASPSVSVFCDCGSGKSRDF